MKHKCRELDNALADCYGDAVLYIYLRDDGNWSMSNGEYESYPIKNCPFCGLRLEVDIEKD